ncbi:hypothetical protein ALC62_04969 [Cyphomyrmex costatus]|uniref:Uncharacterized protein n=1 Tax=Cyphomyrmex costatus TaxID=456900 RepID=A0A195CVL9_9HYME|nr:hypothetical protein ALC62_04969 [Cyphomyrmex costatus]
MSPTPHLFVEEGACRNLQDQSRPDEEKIVRENREVNTCPARRGAASYFANATATNPSDEVHEFTVRGEERRWSTEKKKPSPRYSHLVECIVEKFTPHSRTASLSETVLQREPYDYSKLRDRHARSRDSTYI